MRVKTQYNKSRLTFSKANYLVGQGMVVKVDLNKRN